MNKMKTQPALFLLAVLRFCTPALADSPIAIKELLRADGSLEITRRQAGAVEFSGYQVTLDPFRGPVFTPAAAAPGWNALGAGVPDQTFAVAVQGTDVYVGGSFQDAGGNPDADFVARWNGTAWQSLGTGVDNYVYMIAVQGSDVYVGGAFNAAGGDPDAAKIARWDGNNWYALGSGLNYAVTAIAPNGSDIYVGGEFFDAGGNPDADGIARWDGNNWNALGPGLNGQVTTICIDGSDVYAGGAFVDAGGNPDGDRIARWDGSTWNPLGLGLNEMVWAIAVQGSDVYVGGSFTFAGGNPFASYMARWDGFGWQNIGYGAFNERVNSIVFYGPDLIAGGFFTDAGGNPDADYIARWDGNNWQPQGQTLNSWIFRLATDGSAIYAAGDFTDAGGNTDADHIARWEDCSASTFTVNILPVAPICNGQTVELTATDGVAWSWSTGETAVSIFVMPSSTETYTVTATDGIGCTASATIPVTVHPNPVAAISGTLFVCPGQTGALTASGGQSYLWNTSAQTAGITVPDVEALYTVTVTDGNTCTATAAVTVTTTTTSSCAYLYGVTYQGGANNAGTIFRIKPDGTGHTILHSFNTATEYYPQAGLTLLNGKLYGLTRYGGAYNKGVLFEFDPGNNTYTVKVHFNGANGAEPRTPLTALNGQLYGVAYWGGSANQGVLFEYTPGATQVTVHKDFDGSDGAYPEGTLKVFNNVLYGTTSGGGPYYGVLFEFNPAGNTYTVKHLFSGTPELNVPNGNLEVYGNKLYGTTYGGGNTYRGGLYEYDLSTGNYLKKVDFDGLNGGTPSVTGPVEYNGHLYGLTASGGTNDNGVLYRFDPSNGNYIKLQDFSSINGALPIGHLAVYNNKFYGATYYGGSLNKGTLFEFDPAGNAYQKLHDFNGLNGYGPVGDLTLVEGLWYADADADGYGNPAVFQISATQPANYVCNNRDCNDTNAAAHPCAIEICNSVDDDCDGQVDEGLITNFNYTYNFTSVHRCDVLNVTWTGGCAAWPVSLALISVSPFVVVGSIVQNIPNTGSYTWTVPAGLAPGNYQLYIREGTQSLTWHYGPIFTVLPDAPLIVVPATTICAGQTATLTAGSSGIYDWSNLETTASITVTPAATTTYTVTVTNAGGCAVSASATITVLPPPVASISGNLIITSGGSTTLTATGGAPYAWSTTSTDDVLIVNAAGIYTVTVTGANGCTASTSVTVTETVPPLPPTFTKLYGDGDANVPDRVKIVDDHLFVAGHTRYAAAPNLASFSKFDGAGNLVWDVRLDIPASIADFERLPDGSGFLLVGHTEPGVSGGAYQDNQVLIARIDNSGDVVWLRTYQQLGWEQMDRILLHPNPANPLFPFYLSSRANYFSPPGDLTSVQLWNIDSDGAINWVKNYFLYDGNQFGRVLLPLPNGDLWLLGNGDGGGVAVRVNGSGVTQETLDLAGIATIYDAKRLSSGEIVAAGTTGFFNGQALVAKFDATMTPVWSKTLSGLTQPKLTGIGTDASGKIYVLGQDPSFDIETYQVLSRITDLGADATLDWSRSLSGDFEEIENGHFALNAAGNQIGYADARRGNPGNPGDWDNLVGLFDLGFSTSCLEEDIPGSLSDHPLLRFTNTLTETNRSVTLIDDRDGELPLPFVCTDPCATEICDGLDNNFNGLIDEGFDQDNDGVSSCAGDCNDNNPAVHLAPNAAIAFQSAAQTICAGESTTLVASGGDFYAWSTGDNTATITVSPAVTTTYTVTVSNGDGCTASASTTVTVNANQPPTLDGLPNDMSLTVECGDQLPYPYPVNAYDFFGNPIPVDYTEQLLPGACPNQYTLVRSWSATDVNATCGNTTAFTQTITVSDTEAPVMIDLPNPALVSLLSTQALPEIPSVTATDNCTELVDVEFSETIYPGVCPGPTTIVRVWTAADACFNIATYSQTITINLVAIISGNLNLCEGQSTTLTASGGDFYDWSTTASSAAITVAPVGVSTYTVTVTDAYGCTATASATVTVFPAPVAAITGNLSVCSGVTTVLTATGGTAYAWSSGPTVDAITVGEGAYTVTVTGDAGCTATASVTVSELPAPAVQVSTNDPYCLNGDLTMMETGGDAVAWSWSGPYGFASTLQSPVIHNANADWAGTQFSVTATDANGCTSSTTFPINNFIPLTAISGVVPNQLVCPGSPTTAVNFSATIPGTIFTWTNDQPGIGLATSGTGPVAAFNAVNTGSTPVTATITVTPVFMGCPGAPVPFTITVQGRAVITGNLSVCPGQNTTLTALGGGTYQWSTGSTQAAVQVSSGSSTTYTVTVVGPTGCVSTATATVVAAPQPNAVISGTLSICNGSNTTLTASGGGTYLWSTGPGTAAITVSPTQNTTYTVTVTGANGCTKTVAATVIVLATPAANISATLTTICAGKYTTLTCTGGNFRLWNTGSTASSITVSPTATSYYSVTTFNNNGCVNSSTVTITVNPAPPAAISGITTICKGSSTTLSSAYSGSYTYKWSNASTASSITVTPLSTTTYTLTVTDGGGCTKSTTAVVTVNALPSAAIVGSTSICPGQSTTLTVSGNGLPAWSTGSAVSSITVAPTVNTTYTVTVTNAAGCTKTASATVTIKTVTPASISAFVTTLCAGQSATLTASSGSSRVWSTGATTSSITVTPALTTTYTVTVTNSNGCTSSATKTITVNAPPTPANAGPAQTICSTGSVTLAANTPVSGTGAWSMVSGPSTALSQFSSTASPAATFTPAGGTGNYVLRWTVSNSPCASSSSTVTITVLPPPTAANAGANQTICPNTAASLGANTASSGTGAWSVVSGPSTSLAQFSSTSNPAAVFTPAGGNGDYVLRWTISKPFCTASSSDVTVTVGPPALPGLLADQVVCTGSPTAAVTFGAAPPGVVCNWTCSDPGIGLAAGGTGNIPSFTAVNNGTTPRVATVTVTPVRVGGFAYIPNSGDGTVSVINTTTDAVTATISVGSGPQYVSVSPDGNRVYVTNSGSGNVSVINTATNTVVATINGLSSTNGLCVSPDGSRLYVCNHFGSLSVINTATSAVLANVAVGSTPLAVCASPDGSKAYVSNYGSNTVSVVNTATNTVSATIGVGPNPWGIDISPDGSKVYVVNNGSNSVSVINTATNSVAATIGIGSANVGVSVHPSGSWVYIQSGGGIVVLNASTNSILTTIGGIPGAGLSVSPDGAKLYAPVSSGNTVKIINTVSNTIIGTVTTGAEPFAVGKYFAGLACSGDPVTFTITVNPAPQAAISGVTTIEQSQSTTLTASGGTAYAWSAGGNDAAIDVTPATTTTYTVSVADGNGCTATASATVTVHPEMIQAFCRDITVELNTDGEYPLAPEEIDDGSFASSGPVVLMASPDLFTCDELGDNTVTLTVTGPAGTTATCMANVTVVAVPPLLYGTAGGPGSQNGTIFSISPDGSSFSNVHIFPLSPLEPAAPLFDPGDGYLYGSSRNGGASYAGTVFRVLPDGSGLEMLHQFDNANGADPYSGLVSIGDGYLYGTTQLGGSSGVGTVYRLQPDGAGFQVIHSFDQTNGGNPVSELLSIGDGYLYGTTTSGGGMGFGVVYRLQPDGTNFSVLHAFDYTSGATANAALHSTGDGYLYGTTENGGSNSQGTVYRLYPDGTGFQLLHEFDFFTGGKPYAGVIGRGDGYLYGTTRNGGANFAGTAYRVQTDGTGFQVLHDFNYAQGAAPYAGLSNTGDGYLYGTTYNGGSGNDGTVYRLLPDGTGFQVLHAFQYGTGGAGPYAGLMYRGDGYLYGTTQDGGNDGTLYRIQPDGTNFQTLVQFNYNILGANPYSKLTLGDDGFLYGATDIGGSSDDGTVYRVRPDGTGFQLLHEFDEVNGASPRSEVTLPGDGYLYGTALLANNGQAPGMVYRLQTDGTGFQILHVFNYTDGQNPQGGLTWGGDGYLYGATFYGGSPGVFGRLFRLHPDGTGFQVIFNFNGTNGSSPQAKPLPGGDGYLYGTAGTVVYRISPDGSGFQVLHTFASAGGTSPGGESPNAGLISGDDGYLYGTTERGGNFYAGTVYRLQPAGTGFQVLHHFDNVNDGAYPLTELNLGDDGYLYGVTFYRNGIGPGTVFRLLPDGTGFEVLRQFNGADAGTPFSLMYLPGYDCAGGRPLRGADRKAVAGGGGIPGVDMFPNPTTGVLYLRLSGFSGEPATVLVLNSLGQRVLERRLPAATNQTEILDLGSVAGGVYWVRVRVGDRQTTVTRRVVVARE